MDAEKQQVLIARMRTALENLLQSKHAIPIKLPESWQGDEFGELVDLLNLLIFHMQELRMYERELVDGNLTILQPSKRNLLASNWRLMYERLLRLSEGMEALAQDQAAEYLDYPGELYQSFNQLSDQVATWRAAHVGEQPEDLQRYKHILYALNNMQFMVLEVTADGTVMYANQTAREYMGHDMPRLSADDDRIQNDPLLEHLARFSDARYSFPLIHEVYDENADNWYKITSVKMQQANGQIGFLHVVDNINEWKRHESRLRMTATIDALSGTFSRQVGMQALEKALNRPREGAQNSAAFIDVDNLKMINDQYGHNAGDFAIKTMGQVLMSSVRENDVVCRFGGDEFMVIFHGCSSLEAENIIRRMNAKLEAINDANEFPYVITFSYGIVDISQDEGSSTKDLIAKMDWAMYANKREKRSHAR